ncbi:phosphoserine phosphatase SerB [Sphingomonas sp. HDW15A]|uniref:phosphoserine phosphatase SerB n=1 Tax=Sphingomonas sp. HDW15A TaxID=2714942 RepID=UPI0014092F7F|nr:phosphoserine phosphatase SerB [Sphingomonas sp. HDW15A]QIK95996.1 phosphoserine phosphatase SerB [Sphingomonas sp. HDW15A]
MLIATLIAAGRLDDRLLSAALDRVADSSFHAWVDEGSAADLAIVDVHSARIALEGWQGCDIVIQSLEHREKALLVADMDSTIIGQECIDELADYAGFKPQVAAITEKAMSGELDFAVALAERVALLRGLPVDDLGECLAQRIRPNPGASTFVRTMRAHGAHTLLVSGGFTDFVAPIAAELGFNSFRANILEREGEKLTGTTQGPIVDSIAKKEALVEAQAHLGLARNAVLAIGDGANDLPMIEAAGLGVAYRAKPVLAERADARLDNHGLDALLWAQGIPRRDWLLA